MKRVAIFAHYDKDNIIDDYVINYLHALSVVVDCIIFSSDCDLSNVELSKIKDLCEYYLAKNHKEYDFGSYKYGFNLLEKNNLLKDFDELLIANDSCYLIGSFENVFAKMNNSKSDFWGLVENCDQYLPHLQSYFIVFRKKTFESLGVFLNAVKEEKKKENIISKYEVGLTSFLVKKGFLKDNFLGKVFTSNPMSSSAFRKEVLIHNFPLVKAEFFLLNNFINGLDSSIYRNLSRRMNCNYEDLLQNKLITQSKESLFLKKKFWLFFKIYINSKSVLVRFLGIKIVSVNLYK